MNMQTIFGILFWVVVAVAVGFGIYGIFTDPTPWWWIFWILLIGTIVGAILLRNRVGWIGTGLAYYCAQMCENNNWWCSTICAIAIVFTISYWLAGQAEPVFLKGVREVSQPAREWTHKAEGQQWIDTWILHGEDYTKNKTYEDESPKPERSKYCSSIHLKLFLFWWIVTAISYPVTRRDEVANAIREGIRRAREKHNDRFGINELGGGGSQGGIGHALGDFAKIAIPFEVLIELVEILFTKLFGKLKPFAQKILSEVKGA